MLRIETRLEAYLQLHAEYRMGYHKVVATLSSGGSETGFVVNSTVFVKENEAPWQMTISWDYFVAEAAKSQLFVKSLTVIPREPETLKGVRQIVLTNSRTGQLLTESRRYELSAKSSGAEDAPITLSAADEIFKRFSAFANDRRVTTAMGLVPGTFATTKEDADAHVKTGMDAVARYALPNRAPASNVFTIAPPAKTEVKRGITQPANSHPGGGVEVIFVSGSPGGTVTGPVKIADK